METHSERLHGMESADGWTENPPIDSISSPNFPAWIKKIQNPKHKTYYFQTHPLLLSFSFTFTPPFTWKQYPNSHTYLSCLLNAGQPWGTFYDFLKTAICDSGKLSLTIPYFEIISYLLYTDGLLKERLPYHYVWSTYLSICANQHFILAIVINVTNSATQNYIVCTGLRQQVAFTGT